MHRLLDQIDINPDNFKTDPQGLLDNRKLYAKVANDSLSIIAKVDENQLRKQEDDTMKELVAEVRAFELAQMRDVTPTDAA